MSGSITKDCSPAIRRTHVTATYTFDVFCTLDGYGSYGPGGDWGGYWSKQGPELLDRRMSLYDQD